jgi:2,3-bisphosphoglycerate-dependent phosphoglycerate mutase
MAKLVLIRHGQSQWNLENRFTGWVDIPLSKSGINEALRAGKKVSKISFDVVYCNTLVRSVETLVLVCSQFSNGLVPFFQHNKGKMKSWSRHKVLSKELPVFCDESLNERYYGDLQGLNKDQTAKKYGKEKVHLWRRSYDVKPPNGESLKDTGKRALPFFKNKILKDVKLGKNVLVVSSGNSLRSVVMCLDNISEKDIPDLEIPTGIPIVYDISSSGRIVSKRFLK